MGVEIIYSDDDIVVVNKPPGISAHGGEAVPRSATGIPAEGLGIKGPTVADFLLEKFPEMGEVGDNPKLRPGIVHRLDKNTSGVMVAARNQKSFLALKEMFQNRRVEKIYHAIACGKFKEREGVINFPIGRLINDPRKRGVDVTGKERRKIRGEREAMTKFKVLRQGKVFALVEVRPETGRMHQIRVHLSALHHPVACDTVYGGKKVCCPEGASRQLLHAFSLSFSYPESRKLVFEADPPPDFTLAAEQIL